MKKLDNKEPILVAPKPRPVQTCSKCGATLIRGPSVSVCENWWCESLPEITAPAVSLEAWAGL